MRLSASIDPRLISPIRQDLEAARQDVLTGIANTDTGRQVLAELVKSDTFAPVGRPTALARMYRGPDGLFLGHAKGIDGKIVGNTKELTPGRNHHPGVLRLKTGIKSVRSPPKNSEPSIVIQET